MQCLRMNHSLISHTSTPTFTSYNLRRNVSCTISFCTQHTEHRIFLRLVYGFDNCVDFRSSAFVLWRFFAPYELDDALQVKLQRREKRASIAISFIFDLLGLSIIVTASFVISRGEEFLDQRHK
jgi:hypothetical protein